MLSPRPIPLYTHVEKPGYCQKNEFLFLLLLQVDSMQVGWYAGITVIPTCSIKAFFINLSSQSVGKWLFRAHLEMSSVVGHYNISVVSHHACLEFGQASLANCSATFVVSTSPRKQTEGQPKMWADKLNEDLEPFPEMRWRKDRMKVRHATNCISDASSIRPD